MNKCIFMGNLTKDFVLSESTSGTKVARGAMAINRGKDKAGNDKGADYPSLIAFGDTAVSLEKYGTKGRRFGFETHLQTGSYEKDGKKVYTTDFVIDRFYFADSKQSDSAPAPAQESEGFMDVSSAIDEELPFR